MTATKSETGDGFSAQERAEMDEQYESWKASPAAQSAVAMSLAKSGVKSAARAMMS